jgi:hypothetical protein
MGLPVSLRFRVGEPCPMASRMMKHGRSISFGSVSSTDQGGGKRREEAKPNISQSGYTVGASESWSLVCLSWQYPEKRQRPALRTDRCAS